MDDAENGQPIWLTLCGQRCELGCDDDSLSEAIQFCTRRFDNRPYCVVKRWFLLDLDWCNQSILYSSHIIHDQAQRPHIRSSVLTSPILDVHENCIAVTRNTAYILFQKGWRLSVPARVYNTIIAGKVDLNRLDPAEGTASPAADEQFNVWLEGYLRRRRDSSE
jgi:hypothetical protein